MAEIFIHINEAPPRTTASSDQAILINPKTGQRFIGKKRGSKSSQAVAFFKRTLAPFVPDRPLDGPLKVELLFTLPWLKKHTKKQRSKGWIYCPMNPDEDNLKKILYDQITRLGIWADDARACDVHTKKGYGDHPGILMRITEIDESPE